MADKKRELIVRIRIESVSLDSTTVKVHPDGTGALKKNGPQAIGKSRGGWTTKIHLVTANAHTAITFALSPSQASDAKARRELLDWGRCGRPCTSSWTAPTTTTRPCNWLWTSASCPWCRPDPTVSNPGSTTRHSTANLTRSNACSGDSRGFRRIFSRFDKLDVEAIRSLGYQPSALARGLRRNRTNMLGMVIPDIANPFFPGVVRGVEDVAYKRSFRVILCKEDNDPSKEASYVRELRSYHIAGLLIIPAAGADIAGHLRAYASAYRGRGTAGDHHAPLRTRQHHADFEPSGGRLGQTAG